MPIRVQKTLDWISLYKEYCQPDVEEKDKKKCVWIALYDENFEKYWYLMHKDCECPCECEDPIRKGLDLPEPYFDVCPSQVYIPDHFHGWYRDPETHKLYLREVNYRETYCIFPIQDCWIEVGPPESEEYTNEFGETWIETRRSLSRKLIYHPFLICLPGQGCTANFPFRCLDRLEIFDTIPDFIDEEDLPILYLYTDEAGRIPCNLRIEPLGKCRIDPRKLYTNLSYLSPIIGQQMGFSTSEVDKAYWYFWFLNLLTIPSWITITLQSGSSSYPSQQGPPPFGYNIPDEVRHFILDYLRPPQFPTFGASRYLINGTFALLLPYQDYRQPPMYRFETPDWSYGVCLVFFLPDNVQYWYHNCKPGYTCPRYEFEFESPECPQPVYTFAFVGCVPISGTTPSPSNNEYLCPVPFCSLGYYPPLVLKTQHFTELPNPAGGVLMSENIETVDYGIYLDIMANWRDFQDVVRIMDFYGAYHSGLPYKKPRATYSASFRTNSSGQLAEFFGEIYNSRRFNDFISFCEQVYNEFLAECSQGDGLKPNCSYDKTINVELEPTEEKKGLIPVFVDYGFCSVYANTEILKAQYDQITGRWVVYFGLDPRLFERTLNRVCIFRYTGSGWEQAGNCDNCYYYQAALDAWLDACFQSPYFQLQLWTSTPHHIIYRDPSKCYCTVRDVLNAIYTQRDIEIYLTCPDGFYPSGTEGFAFESPAFGFCPRSYAHYPCGPYLIRDISSIGTTQLNYVVQCYEFSEKCPGYDIIIDDKRVRLLWDIVPYFYYPCQITWTTTTTPYPETTTPEPEPEEETGNDVGDARSPCIGD